MNLLKKKSNSPIIKMFPMRKKLLLLEQALQDFLRLYN